ncbi:MAG: hypothetical protein ACRDRS_03220 [Pseudonocardiaceae bacterium]
MRTLLTAAVTATVTGAALIALATPAYAVTPGECRAANGMVDKNTMSCALLAQGTCPPSFTQTVGFSDGVKICQAPLT